MSALVATVARQSEREYVRLHLRPITITQARKYIAEKHRHNEPPNAHRVSVGIEDDAGNLRGVGVLGRPTGMHLDDGWTAEVVRIATDGVPNGCSMLYGALVRAAKAIGYRRVVTFTLVSESGVSLRASGWTATHEVPPGRSRDSTGDIVRLKLWGTGKHPDEAKIRWEIAV